MKTSNLGYPRIGSNREWKRALEAFWKRELTEASFLQQMEQIRLANLQKQKDMGIDIIPVNDFTLYDHMLDMAVMFGLVPKRFEAAKNPISLYFGMARGKQEAVACEMTKWFNTNYHYIVPEWEDRTPRLVENKPLTAYKEAKEKLGIEGKPVIVGPVTFIKCAKGYLPEQEDTLLSQLVPLYCRILQELEQAGAQWIQIDEPIFVTSLSEEELTASKKIYEQFHKASSGLNIMLQTYFESAEHYKEIIQFPVQGIGLDFVHGEKTLDEMRMHGFPEDKVLGAGILDGRNIWRANLSQKQELILQLEELAASERIWIQPSCSLLHVPVSAKHEHSLPQELYNSLAFADEKLEELRLLSSPSQQEAIKKYDDALYLLNSSPARNRTEVLWEVEKAQGKDLKRNQPYMNRKQKQQEVWNLPLLPTTTIGSFPQTAEVKQARGKHKRGEWTKAQYDQFVKNQIEKWIKIQEDIGLDVLVHGEFERTDMVEFFGQKLNGFAFLENGWVQSYGSRCVKPPVIYGDVDFSEPMTVNESVYAQSLTDKPVKGMLTGPVTILNWSFVRDDISRENVCYQIANALQKEVLALESAGITMIQVDEPALREGLPLKKSKWQHYIDWSVNCFLLTTCAVKETTQIHTHMCYCDFNEFLGVISKLDADVISLETSRSHGELVSAFTWQSYEKGIGLGVYDIHSPRIPEIEEMRVMIEKTLEVLHEDQMWVNPDCGLKTRNISETIQSLKNMTAAAALVRKKEAVS
ncbi:5-methyltetrahydropteroyltriglutamate--homocysteine S-methyltransferase [Fictibacillus sp. KIGAM418]|uniref:5-methyltetrahydropteroyltriglutamate--homocysteine methyltransferase n=1 Tax=Fictibacillus marinisediminis TaxID=2878389 RepID=A0A9X1X9G5_9BACL|nr:5-methyltetrahydropteroyltriglutamate--homocysteine S-methyltransferase [Fictibacillus marinisediminis]MCK6256476.1 5-methyltetrahydropteroyltriglutamate--homocysteine S-methyltransferase [Fictibacillus marinisediminis]